MTVEGVGEMGGRGALTYWERRITLRKGQRDNSGERGGRVLEWEDETGNEVNVKRY